MTTATKARRAIVEIHGQKAKGSWPTQGPDTYVAVQVVPEGVEPLKCINEHNATLRGIEIIYCGEGYAKNSGPQSALGRALAKARKIAVEINIANRLLQACSVSVEWTGRLPNDAEQWDDAANKKLFEVTVKDVQEALTWNDLQGDSEQQEIDMAISIACEPEGLPDNGAVAVYYN